MTPPDQRDPDEIREDARETRRQVSEDLDDLGQRLSPEGLKDEASSALDGAEDIAADLTRDVADRATRRAEEASERVSQRLESLPVPLALIGLGVGWVLMRADAERGTQADERASTSSHSASDRYEDRGEYEERAGDEEAIWSSAWVPGAIAAGAALLAGGVAALVTRRLGEQGDRYARSDVETGYRRSDRANVVGGVIRGTQTRGRRTRERDLAPERGGTRERGITREHGVARERDVTRERDFAYDFDEEREHFKSAHQSRYGDDPPFERYEEDYRFGTKLGASARLSDKSWDEIEDVVRGRWKARGRSDWDERKDAVRYGFERVRVLQDPHADSDRLP